MEMELEDPHPSPSFPYTRDPTNVQKTPQTYMAFFLGPFNPELFGGRVLVGGWSHLPSGTTCYL